MHIGGGERKNCYLGAFGCEQLRSSAPDAPTGAGDDGYFSVKSSHKHLLQLNLGWTGCVRLGA
jgi:hypothetical protein